MAYCKKCGAYIPIGDTACPACGYDPEEEARQAQAAQAQAEEEERRKKVEAAAAERKRKAAEKKAEQERTWAEQEREREERQRRQWSQDPRQSQGYGGAAQSQYASQRTGRSGSQYASQRTENTWTPPWQETQSHSGAQQSYYDQRNRAQAADSTANQGLSVLSYLGPLFLIPLLTRSHDDFARYHANQGLILFLFNGLVSLMTGATSIAAIGSLFSLYCMIKGISNVLKGKKEPLPLIGKFKLLK